MPAELNIEQREEIGFEVIIRYFDVLLKRRHRIIGIFSILTFSALIYLLTLSPTYVAKTTLLPSGKGATSPLQELSNVSLMGFNLQGGSDFSLLYEEIVKSRRVITKILKKRFRSDEHKKKLTLLDILVIKGERIEERLDIGYERFLSNMLEVTFDNRKRITSIYVRTHEPQLSADIAHSLIDELDKYSREITIKEAIENKVFIESRLTETLNLLEIAEENLKGFRETNKRIEKSPDLQLEQGRLAREVRVQEEVYLHLKKEHEKVKVEEVKSLTTVRVLDEAVAPIFRDGPRRLWRMGIFTFVSLILGIMVAISEEYFKDFYHADFAGASIKQKVTTALKADYNLIKLFLSKVGVIR